MWVTEKLSWRRPHLSALFESNVARVVNVDARLSAHLRLFEIAYTSLEEHVSRVAQDAQRLRTLGELREIPRSPMSTAADAKAAANALALAGTHAGYAEYFITEFVLNSTPAFLHRIRMRICPNEQDRKSKVLPTEPKA